MPICVSEPTGALMPALGELDPGDQRGGDGAEADGEHAEAPSAGATVGDGGVAMADQGRNVERSSVATGAIVVPVVRLHVFTDGYSGADGDSLSVTDAGGRNARGTNCRAGRSRAGSHRSRRAVRTDRLRRFLRADAGHPGSRVSAGCSTGRGRTGSGRGSRRPRPDVRRRQAARVAVLRRVAGADRGRCRRLPHRRQPRRHDDPFVQQRAVRLDGGLGPDRSRSAEPGRPAHCGADASRGRSRCSADVVGRSRGRT